MGELEECVAAHAMRWMPDLDSLIEARVGMHEALYSQDEAACAGLGLAYGKVVRAGRDARAAREPEGMYVEPEGQPEEALKIPVRAARGPEGQRESGEEDEPDPAPP